MLVDGEPQAVTAALARGEVLVSEVLASKAGVRRGGTVTVQTPAGVAALRVAGVYSAGFLANPDGALQMDASTFRRLWADDRVTTVTLFLEPTARADDVAAAIQRAFGESHGVFVIDYDDFRALGLNRLAQPYHLAQAMNVLVAMMAGFGVLSTLLASVLDRQREISLLRSVGATRSQVAIGVLAEALLLGALGLAVGCLLGMLGARVLVNIFDVFNWHVPFVVPVGALVVELTLILLVVLAGRLVPGTPRGRPRPCRGPGGRIGGRMIRLEGVTREYGQGDACVRALVDIDTTISRGEFVSLMGPSGSGKSTLLHLIGRDRRADAGRDHRRRAPPLGDD